GEILTISSDVANAVGGDKKECEFIGKVKLSTKSGLFTETEKMFVDLKKEIAFGDTEIAIFADDTQMFSRKYFFDIKERILTLSDDARGVFKFGKINADRLVIHFDDARKEKIKSAEAVGNSVCITRDYILRAREIKYFADKAQARGGVVLLYASKGNSCDIRSDDMDAEVKSGIPDNIRANGSLTVKTKNATIRGDKGVRNGDCMKVFGNVVISGERGNVLGNEAVLNMKTGDIVVKQSGGIVDDGIRE
ncbi:MAG: LPS export ABC transporter periplasmic protein LptC, partial [Holosporaceae bacterium]|nr:LPS export ABC transporter periplasmic protein LptC [Holosporaceae bacterium]